MAVRGKRVERHIAQESDIRHLLLDGSDGSAHEIIRIERFGAAVIAQIEIGVWKQRDARNAQFRRSLGVTHGFVDRNALDPGHGGDRYARAFAADQKQRPDQVVDCQHMLAHHSADPFGLPVAPRPHREIEPGTGQLVCLGRRETHRRLERAAEFDGHGDSLHKDSF